MVRTRRLPRLLRMAPAAICTCALVAGPALATLRSGRKPAPVPAPQHSGTIRGVVLSLGSPTPARVCVEMGRPCVATDSQGRFRMDGVPPGRRTLVVFAEGLEITQLAIDVPEVDRRPVTVRIDCPRLLCDYPGRAPIGPGCLRLSSEERARIGTPCQVHPWVRLLADTAGVMPAPGGTAVLLPGQREAERDSFPNARVLADQRPRGGKAKYAEIAYCPECRRACERWRARLPEVHR